MRKMITMLKEKFNVNESLVFANIKPEPSEYVDVFSSWVATKQRLDFKNHSVRGGTFREAAITKVPG